jgi:hypothetical protein
MMKRLPDNMENDYMTYEEIMKEIKLCLEMLQPYMKFGAVPDKDYFYNKNSLNLMFDVQIAYYNEYLKNKKRLTKHEIKKFKKKRDYYKDQSSEYEKIFWKIEKRKSPEEEVNETMDLIKKGFASSGSEPCGPGPREVAQ